MRILATDPGERCGWVVAEVGDSPDDFEIITQGVTPIRPFALKLLEAAGNYDAIIYEVWRLRPNKARAMIGNDFQPSQLIGMIRLCAWHHGVQLVSQGAEIKHIAERTMPDWLKKHMSKSSEQHDQDAIMHAWHYHWERNIAKTK